MMRGPKLGGRAECIAARPMHSVPFRSLSFSESFLQAAVSQRQWSRPGFDVMFIMRLQFAWLRPLAAAGVA